MTATLISTLIGGLLALSGALIGPFLQRKHDRWLALRRDHENLRQKAEELFEELDILVQQAGRATVRTLEKLKDENLEAIAVPDLGRVRALATVYFPTLLTSIDQFETKQKENFRKIVPELRNAGEVADAGKIQALHVILVFDYQQNAIDLVNAMRREMVQITPKFEEVS